MPTVLRIDGYNIVIYLDDYEPAHVHVQARGCEAVILLNCPSGATGLRDRRGFTLREVNRIHRIIKTHQSLLCSMWKDIHGLYA